jgi:hypothetical protein
MNRCFPFFLAAATLAQPVLAQSGELDVTANTPAITVSTRPAGRNFMRLPDLDFLFVIDARCPTGLQPGSLSISIADTRVSLGAAEAGAAMPLNVPVSVPASQIGPIAVARFCAADGDTDTGQPDSTMTFPAVLSAQVSLLCTGEAESDMSYVSRALDVTLHCESPTDAENDTPSE